MTTMFIGRAEHAGARVPLAHSLAAVTAGKHALVEGPAARWAHELNPSIDTAKRTGALVHVGFNQRYHQTLLHAKRLSTRRIHGRRS